MNSIALLIVCYSFIPFVTLNHYYNSHYLIPKTTYLSFTTIISIVRASRFHM